VAVFRQGIGTRHHEQRAVHHAHHIKSPGVWVVEDVTGEDFPADHECQ